MYECQYCEKPASLRCGKCKVASYCCRKCQEIEFTKNHKSECKKVATCKKNLDKAEYKLRNWKIDTSVSTIDMFSFGDTKPFDAENIGRFWGLLETRPFMKEKFEYFSSLEHYGSVLALELAEVEGFDMMKLCRSDNLGVRNILPGVLLSQEGKEQKCYDFIKWHLVGTNDHYDWANNTFPYLNIENANMLEPQPTEALKKYHSLAFIVALMIIKLKLYHNFLEFKKNFYHFLHGTIDEKNPLSRFSGNHLVLREIYQFSCYVPSHAKIEEPCCESALKIIKSQIVELFQLGAEHNAIIWKGLKNPSPLLSQPCPGFYSWKFRRGFLCG